MHVQVDDSIGNHSECAYRSKYPFVRICVFAFHMLTEPFNPHQIAVYQHLKTLPLWTKCRNRIMEHA